MGPEREERQSQTGSLVADTGTNTGGVRPRVGRASNPSRVNVQGATERVAMADTVGKVLKKWTTTIPLEEAVLIKP